MGIVPRDSDRPSSPPDHILGRNGEETAKTRTKRAPTALEIPIPKQVTPWAEEGSEFLSCGVAEAYVRVYLHHSPRNMSEFGLTHRFRYAILASLDQW